MSLSTSGTTATDDARFVIPVPDGWSARRQGKRHWWVLEGRRYVAELDLLRTGEWWLCPDPDTLPWGQTFPTAHAAVDALFTWWKATRRTSS